MSKSNDRQTETQLDIKNDRQAYYYFQPAKKARQLKKTDRQ